MLRESALNYLKTCDIKAGETVRVGWFVFRITGGDNRLDLETPDFTDPASFTSDFRIPERIHSEQHETLRLLGAEETDCAMTDSALVSRSYLPGESNAFIERCEPVSDGDCGWYVGVVDDPLDPNEPESFVNRSLYELTVHDGRLARFWLLPAGYRVYFDTPQTRIERVGQATPAEPPTSPPPGGLASGRSYAADILIDILTYACRGSGKYLLLTCMVLSIVASLAGIAPLVGPIAGLLVSAYFCAIYFQMIQSSATGGKEAPEFPDTANLIEDIIWPMLQVFVVFLVSFGPYFGYALAGGDHPSLPVAYGLLGLGIIYFPMAMLAVVVLGYTGALSPRIVVPAVFRGGWLYWLGVIMLCLLYIGESLIEAALAGSLIFGTLVMSVVGAYTLMTNARILGVVYRERQDELGWL